MSVVRGHGLVSEGAPFKRVAHGSSVTAARVGWQGVSGEDAPTPADEGTERPGGWVEGIGWVALPDALHGDDEVLIIENVRTLAHQCEFAPHRPVIVTRWADGTTPQPEGDDWDRAAFDLAIARLQAAKEALHGLTDRMDEFAYGELSCVLDDDELDEWGESYTAERDRLRSELAARTPVPSPAPQAPQPDEKVQIDEATAAHIVTLAGYAVAASHGYREAAGIRSSADAVVPVVESLVTDNYLDTWNFTRTRPPAPGEQP